MSSEFLLVLEVLLSSVSILLLLKYFGKVGLYLYGALATVLANYAVLKASPFSFSSEPIALGTGVFASVFLVTDILNEKWGKEAAQKMVVLSFISMLLMTGFQLLFWLYPVAPSYENIQDAFDKIFMPLPKLFVASLMAYFFGQFVDIYVFVGIKKMTGDKWLWLRGALSTTLATFLDNFIFSILAWYVFSPGLFTFSQVMCTYVLGVFGLRVLLSIVNVVPLYISKLIK